MGVRGDKMGHKDFLAGETDLAHGRQGLYC